MSSFAVPTSGVHAARPCVSWTTQNHLQVLDEVQSLQASLLKAQGEGCKAVQITMVVWHCLSQTGSLVIFTDCMHIKIRALNVDNVTGTATHLFVHFQSFHEHGICCFNVLHTYRGSLVCEMENIFISAMPQRSA